MTASLREERANKILQSEGSVKRLDEHEYQVKSQSGNGVYQVLSTEFGWVCSCPDNQFRGLDCKHILAVQISLAIRKIVKEVRKIQPIEGKACIFCASEDLMKWGVRHNKSGDIQKFKCSGCGKFFTINLGFEGMKHSAKAITTAMQLYFSGESLRNAQRSLKLLGVKVTHKTVWSWIRKYVKLMEEYLDKITPTVGDVWRTDELYLKMKGNMKYLFAMMDDETRFRIAQQVADHKGTSDVRPMFRRSIEVAEKKPKVLISDGANNF